MFYLMQAQLPIPTGACCSGTRANYGQAQDGPIQQAQDCRPRGILEPSPLGLGKTQQLG